MTPRTRSGGEAPPSSIVYKSTPTLKQVQFPARRRRVRTYGKRNRRSSGGGSGRAGDEDKENEEGSSAHPTPNLKQKTLTQYDFASSSFNAESVVELSDASDVENLPKVEDTDEAEKENNVPKGTKRRRSSMAKRAPLLPILDLEEEDEDEEEKEEEEELRVPDTEAEEEEEEEADEGPVVRGRRRAGFASAGKAKRRRTLGEEHRLSTMKESRASRRRTLGDSPIAAGPSKPRYHTQTLTQFMGRTTSCVADSDDDDNRAENDGFLEWLGGEEPQSPSMGTQASKRGAAAAVSSPAPAVWEDQHSPSPRRSTRRRPAQQQMVGAPSREESVVPQTPVKSLRFDLPPSAQHILSPSPTRMAALYGAPNADVSPSSQRLSQKKKQQKGKSPAKPLAELTGRPTRRVGSSPATKKQPELVIQDSYATEGWSSVGGTQARHGMSPSQTQQTEVFSTPAEDVVAPPTAAAITAPASAGKAADKEEEAPPPHTQSSQDGQVEEQFYGALSQMVQDSQQPPPPATPQQATRSATAAAEEEPLAAAAGDRREIPDSDDDEGDFGGAESDVADEGDFGADSDAGDDDDAEELRFAAGAETQLLMDQLQSSVRKWSGGLPRAAPSSSSVASPHPPRTSSPAPSPGGSAATPQSAPPSSSLKPPVQPQQQPKRPAAITHDIPVTIDPGAAPLRTPLHHPHEPLDTQGLPLESQRVALGTLQGFTPASARTDVLLPLSRLTLAQLVSGHQDAVVLPFKIPVQVVRFWLLHDNMLRYLVCVAPDGGDRGHDPKRDNGCGGHGTWTYRAAQVYELNNPVHEDDMRAEDWIHGRVARYVYFPPAVVSQLLWNLRQALFADPAEEAEEQEPEVGGDAVTMTSPAVVALSSSSPLRRSSRLSTPAKRRAPPPPPVSSSPLQHARFRPPPSTMPAPPPPARPSHASRKHHTQPTHFVRPSQATTASQASTVDMPASPAAVVARAIPRSGGGGGGCDESSESLVFDDHGGSSIPMPYSGVSGLVDDHLEASQLLTKSQILPESLVRDEEEGERAPDEIWDSDEE